MAGHDKTQLRYALVAAVLSIGLANAVLTGTAHAQEQQNEGGEGGGTAVGVSPLTGQPVNEWIKVCEQNEQAQREMCITSYELRDQRGGFLATVGARVFTSGDEEKRLLISVPPGMLLRPGFRVQIDEGEQLAGEYTLCIPQRCFGEIEADAEDLFEKMKAGNQILLLTITSRGQTVPFPVTLSGFTAAFDGTPTDVSELQANREKFREEMQKRAEEARQRMLNQNQGNTGDGSGG